MKNFLLIFALTLCAFAGTTFADDFKSMVIPSDGAPHALPRVHGDQFMVIRNFTQESSTSSTRGVVTITTIDSTGIVIMTNVLTAAILSTTTSPPADVINSVVIAGPADVSVTCGATTGNCFISYKKDSN
jgi:hypothetical protein